MAERFNLTAQIQLQAPTNVNQVANQIKKQLAPIGNVDVQIKADTRALRSANDQLNKFNKAARNSNKSVSELNRTIAESARRFSVITVATGTLLGLVNAFKSSVKGAIEFEREIVKIQQVTGKTANQLKGLTDEVTRLSTSLGASSADLLNVSRVLLQTGLSADKTRKALDVLAKTSLGATFDSIQDTTEGAIALLRQFGGVARRTGREIEFLEQSLDAINAVSKSFAVESGDLVTAIRRVGGVFASAGGEVNELIALFTSVRATTRESAETIATGLRTIFTRIQRAETVNQLRELGIELQDAQGNFVGAFEAFKRLSSGLATLDPRSFRFSEIVEQLGGFRQIGKVIPLIQQFTTAQQALNVAQGASGSVAKDAQTAQQSLAVQIQKTKEQFDALIRSFADSTTFRSVIDGALKLAQALIRIGDALGPVLPLLANLFALKLGAGLGKGLAAFAGFSKGGTGSFGPVSRFNRGGVVPGTGNTDSVPAMLTPGEFVIRKSSVKKLGAANLAAMNQNRYSHGGNVKKQTSTSPTTNFAHISEISSRRQAGIRGISSRLGGREVVKAYTNMGLDLPASWNNDWNRPRNNHGVFREKLAKYIRNRDVFKTLKGRGNPIYRLAEGTKENKDLQNVMAKNALNIRRDLSSSLMTGRRKFFDIDPEVYTSDLGPKLIKSVEKNAPELSKAVQRVSAIKTKEGASRRSLSGIVKGGYKNPIASEFSKRVGKFFGGPVQKFDLGGIVRANKVGAAILETDKGAKTDSIKVGINDVKPFIPGSGFKKDKAQKNFGKVTGFTGKTYTLTKQGLNEATSNNFSNVLFRETAEGIDKSVQALSNDLGLGSISLGNKNVLSDSLRKTGIVGALFESTLNTLQNRGQFSPEAAGAPFDFPGGLSGKLADNYNNLPLSWVDAKSSFREASAKNFKTKIAREISDEYVRSGDYDKALSGKGFAAGGGVAGSDTVPALLTPGEFVINKKAAANIGAANLDRMNKRGIQGFAKGGPVGFQTGGSVSNVQAFAAQADQIAGAAQQFVFLGASISAVTAQMGFLDDATGAAVAETAGFVTGLVGITGTLTSTIAPLISANAGNTAAVISDTIAETENTLATKVNTETQKAQTAAGAQFATSLSLILAGVTLVLGGLKFLESQAANSANALAKQRKKTLEEARSGKGFNRADFEKKLQEELKARDRAAKAFDTTSVKTSLTTMALTTTATAAAFMAFGAPLGPAGIAVASLLGGAVGLTKSFFDLGGRVEEGASARQREVDSIMAVIDANLQLAQKSREYSESFADLELSNIKGSELVQKRLEIQQRKGVSNFTENAQAASEARNLRRQLGVSSVIGMSREDIVQAGEAKGLDSKTIENIAIKAEQLSSTLEQGAKFAQNQIQQSQTTLGLALRNLDFSAAGKESQELFKKARAEALAAIKADNARRLSEADTADEEDVREQNIKRIQDFNKGYDDAIKKGQEAQAQLDAEIAARKALLTELRAQRTALANARIGFQNLQSEFKALDIAGIIDAGGVPNINIEVPELSGELVEIEKNLQNFNSQISSLPAQSQKEAKKARDSFINITKAVDSGVQSLENLTSEDLTTGITGAQIAKLAKIELDPLRQSLPADVIEDFLADLQRAAATGAEISPEEAAEAFKPIEEAAKTSGAIVQQYAQNAAQQAKNAQKQLQNEQDERKRAIDRINGFSNVLMTGSERIAQISGGSAAEGRSFGATAAAQRLLDAGRKFRGGQDLRAGNLSQLKAAKIQAKALLAQEKKALIDAKSYEEQTIATRKIQELQNTIEDVDTELGRMAKSTNEFAAIQERASKAQRAREQAFAILEQFVVGGREDRDALTRAASGIVAAVRTGTLQNQGEEQRKATVGLLDQLSDVLIGNTGLTGKELKQELVFRDAVRLGFPPQIAKELATSTTIEKQILEELRLLNRQAFEANFAQMFLSKGGPVYRAGGGSIFEPRGTDTVPAMLTPGEFVVRKSAVNKVGVDTLKAINSGNSTVYAQDGGLIAPGSIKAGFSAAMNLADRRDFRAIQRESGAENITYSNFKVAQQKGGAVKYLNDRGVNVSSTIETLEKSLYMLNGLSKSGLVSFSKEFGQVSMSWRDNDKVKQQLNSTIGDLEILVGDGRNSSLAFVDQALLRYSGGRFTLQKDIIDLIDAYKTGESYREKIEKQRQPTSLEMFEQRSNETPFQRARRRRRNLARGPRGEFVPNPTLVVNPGPPDAGPFDNALTMEELGALSAQADAAVQEQRQAALDKPLTQVRTSEREVRRGQLIPSTQFTDPTGDGSQTPERTSGFAGLPKPVKQRVERKNRAGITLEQRIAERKNRDPNQQGKIPAFDPEATRKYIENYEVSPETKDIYDRAKKNASRTIEEAKRKAEAKNRARREKEAGLKSPSEIVAEVNARRKQLRKKEFFDSTPLKTKEKLTNRQLNELFESYDAANKRSASIKTRDLGVTAGSEQGRRRTAFDEETKRQQADIQEFNRARGIPQRDLTAIDEYLSYVTTGGLFYTGLLGRNMDDFKLPELGGVSDTERAIAAGSVTFDALTGPFAFSKAAFGSVLTGAFKGGQKLFSGGANVLGNFLGKGARAGSNILNKVKNAKLNATFGGIRRFSDTEAVKALQQSAKNAGVKQSSIRRVNGRIPLEGVEEGFPTAAKASARAISDNNLSQQRAIQKATDLFKQSDDISRNTGGLRPLPRSIRESQPFLNTPAPGQLRRSPLDSFLYDLNNPIGINAPGINISPNLRYRPGTGVPTSRSQPNFIQQAIDYVNRTTNNPIGQGLDRLGVSSEQLKQFRPFYRNRGGGVPGGNDRVPAMLTPGEFVMSPEAVNKYGVGYMKSLNRGRVPGFRRGGIVGRGNVQYRQNGGGIVDSNAMMSLDASNIQSVLETFNQQFQATLDTVVNQFSSLSNAMNNLAGVFGSGFTMTHTFTGDMSMAFKIDNLPELQQSIAKAITPTIVEQVKKIIDDQGKGFKAG